MSRVPRFETLKGRRRHLPFLGVVLLGLAIFSPAIRAPLFLDDYLHVAMVEGTFAGKRGPFELYDFVDDGDRSALAAGGLLPWWSHPELTIRFFRPLSSALLWGGHRLFAHHALPLHLHSLAWWLAAVLAVRALYARLFSERATLLATAIFALSPCHALPLAWLANFETLVALAFGALGLSRQLTFRSEHRVKDAALAAACFSLSLLGGGEYALAFGGYVLALEIALRRRRELRAPTSLEHVFGVLPFAVPAAAYLVARTALRYGARGSGFYTDPLHDPLGFVRSAPDRVVALLADSWLTLGSERWLPGYQRWLLATLVLAIAVALVSPIRRAIGALAPERAVAGRMLLWGSLLALGPTLAVVPAFRLLGVSMIGVAATTGLLLDFVWFAAEKPAPPRAAALGSLAAIVLAFAQLVHGPVTAFLASRIHRRDGEVFALRAAWTRAVLREPTRADVAILRGMAGSFFLPYALDPQGRPPLRWRLLAHAGHVLALRPEEKTIELVASENRSLYPIGEQNLYRDRGSPLHEGDVVRAPGMTVTILEVGPAGPRRARFVFDEAPEASTWIAEELAAPTSIELPAVGQGAPFDP